MKKIIAIVLLIIAFLIHLFANLAIELDLKTLTSGGFPPDSITKVYFRIRDFSNVQLGLYTILSIVCFYLIIKKIK